MQHHELVKGKTMGKRGSLSVCFFVLLCAALIFAAKSFAQVSAGSISGIVIDESGAVVPGATVTAVLQGALQSGKIHEILTDNEGRFMLQNLPTGVYQISFVAPEFNLQTEKNIRVSSSIVSNVSLKFRLIFLQGCDNSPDALSTVTDEDKAQITKLILETALLEKVKIPDYKLLTEGKNSIILSTKNIRPNWLPLLPGVKLVIMKPQDIQRKANREGDFLYLSFTKFVIKGSCVAVSLDNTWAVGKHSGMGYLSGGGFTYEYHKISGKWVGKFVSGYIS